MDGCNQVDATACETISANQKSWRKFSWDVARPRAMAEGEPTLFTLLLRASDTRARDTWVAEPRRRRIVLLHGWLQDHSCWLTTAHRLRARYGHDCLLLDWLSHGRSDAPSSSDRLNAAELLLQLRRAIERAGWADGAAGRPLTLAGCSLGGAIAMRYASTYEGEVDRIVLVAPAGFDEPFWRLSRVAQQAASVLTAIGSRMPIRDAPPIARVLMRHAHLIRETPRYGNDLDWFNSAAGRRVRVLLVSASWDEVHTAHRWAHERLNAQAGASARASSGALGADAGAESQSGAEMAAPLKLVRYRLTHPLLCMYIDQLHLDDDAGAWHEVDVDDDLAAARGRRAGGVAGAPHPRL